MMTGSLLSTSALPSSAVPHLTEGLANRQEDAELAKRPNVADQRTLAAALELFGHGQIYLWDNTPHKDGKKPAASKAHEGTARTLAQGQRVLVGALLFPFPGPLATAIPPVFTDVGERMAEASKIIRDGSVASVVDAELPRRLFITEHNQRQFGKRQLGETRGSEHSS